MNLDQKVQYRLKKSRRRHTVAIRVLTDGSVEVLAPYGYRRETIDRIVTDKKAWIERKQKQFSCYPRLGRHTYEDGDVFYLFGLPKELKVIEGKKSSVTETPETLIVTAPGRVKDAVPQERRSDSIRRILLAWYRETARQWVQQRVMYWCGIYPELRSSSADGKEEEVRIRLMRRRWGSCDQAGRLTFSTRLICAPPELTDYVVIHELCHRREFNHSAAFYSALENYLPNHRELQRRLRESAGLWTL